MAIATSLPEFPTTLGPPPTFADRPVLRFTVEQYHQMIAAGVLREDQRIELLEGVLLEMTPVSAGRRYCVAKLAACLRGLLGEADWHVVEQAPVTLAESEPQPDIAVVRGKLEDYRARNPRAEDLGLLVEVAESSLTSDRQAKARAYAAARIPAYWIVNLVDRQVETFGEPAANAQGGCEYRRRAIVQDEVELILAGRRLGSIRLAEILP